MRIKNFSLQDLILIALLASLSIATKPFVSWLSNSITASAHLPGGLVGGVFYMMWLSLVYRLVGKRFSVLVLLHLTGTTGCNSNRHFPS
jgi:uncharacterized membrane protein